MTLMMHLILWFILTILFQCKSADDSIKYTTKYDNLDLDEIIGNDRLLKNYVNCLLDKGNCTPDGAELKRILPHALHTDCSKCSPNQKNGSRKMIRYLIDNKKDWWSALEAKYDPKATYRIQYENQL